MPPPHVPDVPRGCRRLAPHAWGAVVGARADGEGAASATCFRGGQLGGGLWRRRQR